MASSSQLFCLGNIMEQAYVLSATSEATGHLKENALDWNLDSYWKPAAVGTNSFVIDLVSAKTVDRVAIWIHNYNVNLNGGSNQYLKVYYSPDNSSYTQFGASIPLPTDGVTIFRFSEYGISPQTYRYWKIELVCPATICEVSGVYLCKEYAWLQGNQLPETEEQGYNVQKSENNAGRVFTKLIRSGERQSLNRSYLFVSTAWDSLPLVQAFKDCKGNWRPLILIEDAASVLLARFHASGIQKQAVSYQVYQVSVTFITETYIPAGSTL